MNILIDVNHPGHVHLFRNAARAWIESGHNVLFTARRRAVIAELLKHYHLPYVHVSAMRASKLGLAFELLEADWNLLRMAVAHRADLLMGTSVSAAHVSRLTKARSIIFEEDDADIVPLFARLAYPFADRIVIPDCLRDKRTPKHWVHNSYHELAYLHPNHFQPDPKVLPVLGVKEGEPFFIVRFVALKAHHDANVRGLTLETRQRLIEELSKRGKVFVSAEHGSGRGYEAYRLPLPPHDIHHALSYAKMVISDSQTMTAEAAVLGTPALRCNSFVGRISYLEELEHRYGLTFGFLPGDEARLFAKMDELLQQADLQAQWQARRQKMLAEKVDLAEWMVGSVKIASAFN